VQQARIAKGTKDDTQTKNDNDIKKSIDDMNGSLKKIEKSMNGSFKKIEKTLSRMQTNFGSVYEVMVRYEQTGSKLDVWTQPLVVEALSDMFYFCSAFEELDQSAALQKVISHIETIFPIFFESFVSGPPLHRTDFDRFLTAPGRHEKSAYLKECIKLCAIGSEKARADLDSASTIFTVKELKKSLETWKHAQNAVECINDFGLVPDITRRFDSKLGVMVLLWDTDKQTILRSLEIDIRGALEVQPLDSAGDTGTGTAASPPPAGSTDGVGVADARASSPPAKKIIAYMGECKMSKRKRQNAVAQLTLRLTLLRSFLLAAELANAGKDQFLLEGRIYFPAFSQIPSDLTQTKLDPGNNTEFQMRTIVSSIRSFAVDGMSSGSEDDSA